MGEIVKLNSKTDDAEFSAYHVQPKARRRGGVILLHEIFGIDAAMRRDAERWGGLGFEVLVPSLFDRQEPDYVGERSQEGMATGLKYLQANGFDNPLDDASTCMDYLRPRGPVFLIGYCYGGSLAWLAACRLGDLAAASSYYGGQVVNHARETPRCPVILHFGEQDQMIPAQATAAAIHEARPDVPIHLYDAGHGFNNQDGQAAELARRRTLALFEENGAA